MSRLQIGEEDPIWQDGEHQATSTVTMQPSTKPLLHKASISTCMHDLRIDSEEKALTLCQAPGDDPIAPKTPSQIPVLSKQGSNIPTPAISPCRTPKSFTHTPQYLTKDSNITSFLAWDVNGRLEDMEAMYSELKDVLTGTSLERNGLEEAVGVYKARGTPPKAYWLMRKN